MFRSGRRLFSSASLSLMLVALLHTLGHFSPPPEDPALASLQAAMESQKFDLGLGMQPSVSDVFNSLSLTMTVTLLSLGALNLAVARADDASGRLVRSFTIVNVVGVGALVAIYGFYRIPPPLITLAAVEVQFLLALVLQVRRHATGSVA